MKEEVKNITTVEKEETNSVETANRNLEKKIRKWKKDEAMAGNLRKLKDHRYYDKPGVKRRNEKKENIKNSRKKQRNR